MRVLVVGGGPAGLYFADLFKRSFPTHAVTLVEQNAPGATYGFGVVFAETALGYLAEADPTSYQRITAALETWRDLTLVHRDRRLSIDGNGFSGISRLELLRILERFCGDAGVEIRHGETATIDSIKGFDLVVGADGLNSVVQSAGASVFQPQREMLNNRFVWYGVSRVFETLTLTFRQNADGHFVAHHYRYAPDRSTFIVECDAATFQLAGFARMTDQQSRAYCERVFAPDLDGHALISNKSDWRRFPVTRVEEWVDGNKVLIGDALRSVHFSIGSGTRLALEDSIALWRAFLEYPEDVPAALAAFEAARRPIVDKLLAAAAGSYGWYEDIAQRMQLSPLDLAYDYMTRSGRVNEERLRRIAPRFMQVYDRDRESDSQID
ncbi:MAG: FAD-dependent monooxygenase [Proteobacteria bacterium]|nr:FAD-dependent monooxygenase [Pseudomonadota bacterium]